MASSNPSEEALSAAYAQLDPQSKWRHVAMVSAHTRRYALHQIVRVQFAYVLGILLIAGAQLTASTVERTTLWLWLAGSALNLCLRLSLFRLFATREPSVAARHTFWRLVPMLNIVIVGLHWTWTSVLFVQPDLDFATFATVLVYLMMSVAAMNYAPASLVPAAAYLAFLWLPVLFLLWPDRLAHSGTFVIAFIAVLAVVCTSMYFTQGQLRRHLAQADEVERLVAELRERNTELQRLRQRADSQLHERSVFFAAASHDFGQRLHAMKLLAATACDDMPAACAEVGQRLASAVSELDHYVHHVLDFARLESGVYTRRMQTFNLQDIFQKIAVNFEATAARRGVDLRVRTCDMLLRSDPGLLLRIVENLVANAIKFTRRGVLLAARRNADGWRIEVWDQGPGIPVEARDRIFQPFQQLHADAHANTEGVGLGLATAKRLAAFLGMRVSLSTRPGRGAVFAVSALDGEVSSSADAVSLS